MTKTEKLEALKAFLKENKLLFHLEYNGKVKVSPDLYIPKHKIMVKLSEGKESDDKFFRTVKFKYHPLFIRDEETVEFILEKMQNLIIDIMTRNQRSFEKRSRKEAK